MSIFAGLAVMILMGPLNAIVARRMKGLQIEQMKNKDKRNKMMDEILNGIKIIKLYAWESSFRSKVDAIRAKEIAALKKIAYLNAGMTFLWVCAPTMVALASFATYVLGKNQEHSFHNLRQRSVLTRFFWCPKKSRQMAAIFFLRHLLYNL